MPVMIFSQLAGFVIVLLVVLPFLPSAGREPPLDVAELLAAADA